LKPGLSSNNLGGVVSSEKRVRLFNLVVGCHTEREDRLGDDSVVVKGPYIVLFSIDHTLLRSKTKDTIRLFAKTMTLVESQKLEVRALVLFRESFSLLKLLLLVCDGEVAGVLIL
jgi:hypothetical protein